MEKEFDVNPRKKLKQENEKIEAQLEENDEDNEAFQSMGLPMGFGTSKKKK